MQTQARAMGGTVAILLHAVAAGAALHYSPGLVENRSAPIIVSVIAPEAPAHAIPKSPTPKHEAVTLPVPALPSRATPVQIATSTYTPSGSEPIAPVPSLPVSAKAEAPAGQPPAAQVASIAVTPPNFDAAYLENPAPAYPAISRRLGEQGRVVLRVLVSASGTAGDIEIRTSSGSKRLDEVALDTVRRWRFVPARQGDRAVAAWVLVPIAFSLGG